MNPFNACKKVVSCLMGSEQGKYDSRHQVLCWLANKCSFRMYNRSLLWFQDKEYLEVWRGFPESTNSIHDRKFNLYYFAKAVRDMEGDTAECGVFRGASSYLILKANEGKNKSHHIFDSFEGASEPGVLDAVEHERTLKIKKGHNAAPEEIARRNLKEFHNVHYHKGWIPDRFTGVKDLKFSFVHIDVNLYQPTYDSMAFFYERMNPGGIIICDDYGFESCPGAHKAMDCFMEDKPESIIHLTAGHGVVIKQ